MTDADRARLCRALKMEFVGVMACDCGAELLDEWLVGEDRWACRSCGEDPVSLKNSRLVIIPPPIDTSERWAVEALRRAGEVWGAHSVEIELPEKPDPDDPPASNFLVDLIFAGNRRCDYMGESPDFPAAVSAALLAALEAGAIPEVEDGE